MPERCLKITSSFGLSSSHGFKARRTCVFVDADARPAPDTCGDRLRLDRDLPQQEGWRIPACIPGAGARGDEGMQRHPDSRFWCQGKPTLRTVSGFIHKHRMLESHRWSALFSSCGRQRICRHRTPT